MKLNELVNKVKNSFVSDLELSSVITKGRLFEEIKRIMPNDFETLLELSAELAKKQKWNENKTSWATCIHDLYFGIANYVYDEIVYHK